MDTCRQILSNIADDLDKKSKKSNEHSESDFTRSVVLKEVAESIRKAIKVSAPDKNSDIS